MAGDTLSTIDDMMKDTYAPGMPEWFSKSNPIFERVEQITDKQQFDGRAFKFPAHLANSQGGGAVGEGETLPAPGQNDFLGMSMAVKYHYQIASLTKQAMAAANSNRGAFKRAVDVAVMGARDQLRDDLAIASIYGDGSGEIGQVSGYSSATLTLYGESTLGGIGNALLRKGKRLSSWSAKSGGVQGADYKEVSGVSPTADTATVPLTAGFTTNDYIFQAVTQGVDPRNKSMMGLGGIIDDGDRVNVIQGVTRTSDPEACALALENGSTLREISEPLMDQLCTASWKRGSGKMPTALYSPLAIQQRMAAKLRADRAYDARVKKLEGGYASINWTFPGGNADWFCDRYCRPHEVMAVHEPDLFRAILEDVQFEELGGGIWRFVDRTHRFEAWLYTFQNLGAWCFNSHAVLRQVSHTL